MSNGLIRDRVSKVGVCLHAVCSHNVDRNVNPDCWFKIHLANIHLGMSVGCKGRGTLVLSITHMHTCPVIN